jgi:hypothetical protein
MAMIYMPREIIRDGKPSGLFHMTAGSDESAGYVYPVGGCAKDCPGHATKDEAEEHWHRSRLDSGLRLKQTSAQEMRKCEVCGVFTPMMAVLDVQPFGDSWFLCEEHCTREHAERLYRSRP